MYLYNNIKYAVNELLMVKEKNTFIIYEYKLYTLCAFKVKL